MLEKKIRQFLSGSTPRSPDDLDAGSGDLPAGLEKIRPRRLVPAAVLVPFIAHDEPTILLTQRNPDLKHHGGQVSFPGGRIETADSDPAHTALRETEEETGIPATWVEVLGYLDNYHTLTGYLVTPVVGLIEPGFELKPDPGEVASVFEVPLSYLMDPQNRTRRTRRFFGYDVGYFEIHWEEHRIWGATASMLVRFLMQLEQADD